MINLTKTKSPPNNSNKPNIKQEEIDPANVMNQINSQITCLTNMLKALDKFTLNGRLNHIYNLFSNYATEELKLNESANDLQLTQEKLNKYAKKYQSVKSQLELKLKTYEEYSKLLKDKNVDYLTNNFKIGLTEIEKDKFHYKSFKNLKTLRKETEKEIFEIFFRNVKYSNSNEFSNIKEFIELTDKFIRQEIDDKDDQDNIENTLSSNDNNESNNYNEFNDFNEANEVINISDDENDNLSTNFDSAEVNNKFDSLSINTNNKSRKSLQNNNLSNNKANINNSTNLNNMSYGGINSNRINQLLKKIAKPIITVSTIGSSKKVLGNDKETINTSGNITGNIFGNAVVNTCKRSSNNLVEKPTELLPNQLLNKIDENIELYEDRDDDGERDIEPNEKSDSVIIELSKDQSKDQSKDRSKDHSHDKSKDHSKDQSKDKDLDINIGKSIEKNIKNKNKMNIINKTDKSKEIQSILIFDKSSDKKDKVKNKENTQNKENKADNHQKISNDLIGNKRVI